MPNEILTIEPIKLTCTLKLPTIYKEKEIPNQRGQFGPTFFYKQELIKTSSGSWTKLPKTNPPNQPITPPPPQPPQPKTQPQPS